MCLCTMRSHVMLRNSNWLLTVSVCCVDNSIDLPLLWEMFQLVPRVRYLLLLPFARSRISEAFRERIVVDLQLCYL